MIPQDIKDKAVEYFKHNPTGKYSYKDFLAGYQLASIQLAEKDRLIEELKKENETLKTNWGGSTYKNLEKIRQQQAEIAKLLLLSQNYAELISNQETEITKLRDGLEAASDAGKLVGELLVKKEGQLTKLREGLEAAEKYIEYLVEIINFREKRDDKKMMSLYAKWHKAKQLLSELKNNVS